MSLLRKEYLPYFVFAIALIPAWFLRDFSAIAELPFLSVADETIYQHDLVSFSSYGTPAMNYPPILLWIAMIGKWVFGSHQLWFLMLFSFIPTIAVIEFVRGKVESHTNSQWSITITVMLLSSIFLIDSTYWFSPLPLSAYLTIKVLSPFFDTKINSFSKRTSFINAALLLIIYLCIGLRGLLFPLIVSLVWSLLRKETRRFFSYWNVSFWVTLLTAVSLYLAAIYWDGGIKYLFYYIREPYNIHFHVTPLILSVAMPWGLFLLSKICFEKFSKVSIILSFSFVILLAIAGIVALTFYHQSTVQWLYEKLADVKNVKNALIFSLFSCILLLITSVATLFFFLKRKEVHRSAIIYFTGSMIWLFVSNFFLPSFNSVIGLKNLSEEIREINNEGKAKLLIAYQIPETAYMDVYLKMPILQLSEKKDQLAIPAQSILIFGETGKNDLSGYLIKEKTHHIGRYHYTFIHDIVDK